VFHELLVQTTKSLVKEVFSNFLLLTLSQAQVFFLAPYSWITSVSIPLNFKHQVSHLQKTKGKVVFLYILTYIFLDSKQGDKIYWTERQQTCR
jgi:hypothetical protein